MANYTTNLKTWGSTGQEYPTNYSYVEGEQPVDAWDNFVNSNIITDLDHLIALTNDRLESDTGTSHPSSPEVGHISYRTDGVVTTEEEIFFYDSGAGVWHRFMKADGDTLTGDIDMNSNELVDSTGSVHVEGASLSKEWHDKQEGGTVDKNSLVPIGTFGVDDGQTLHITQAMLMKDGLGAACVSGVDLIITDGSSSLSTILSGDGSTVYDDETAGWTYSNSTGGHQTIAIALDNGHFNAGYGSAVSAYGGFIARVE